MCSVPSPTDVSPLVHDRTFAHDASQPQSSGDERASTCSPLCWARSYNRNQHFFEPRAMARDGEEFAASIIQIFRGVAKYLQYTHPNAPQMAVESEPKPRYEVREEPYLGLAAVRVLAFLLCLRGDRHALSHSLTKQSTSLPSFLCLLSRVAQDTTRAPDVVDSRLRKKGTRSRLLGGQSWAVLRETERRTSENNVWDDFRERGPVECK